ncbi:MAG: lipoxygenase family protein [Enhygromyxa sp.]
MLPSLPQFDPETDQRAAAVANQRAEYSLDRGFGGLPFPTQIPLREMPAPGYALEAAAWSARSAANIAAAQVQAMHRAPDGGPGARVQRLLERANDAFQRRVWGPSRDVRVPNWRERTPLSIADYHMFPLVPEPESLPRWAEDWWFARQRVAGCNPILIRSIDRVPDNVPLREADYARAIAGDSLAAALAERRLFVSDYAMLEGIEAGTGDGYRKWLYAPIALFALTPDRAQLLPVCIQCEQRPGPRAPLFFPWHGTAWLMARTVVQVSDSNHHGVVIHGVHTHMLMGLVSCCMRRSLAPSHPLTILLEPNLQFSYFIDSLTEKLFLPGGRTPTIQSVSEQGTIDLASWGYRSFDWTADSVPETFVRRGVADPSLLPDYPARDDLLAHYRILRRYVATYVQLYYASDEDVIADYELQAFVAALQDPAVGGLHGVGVDGRVQTIEALVEFLTQAIQRASSYHAAINYSVYPDMGFMPNMAMAQYAPAPHHQDHPWEDFVAMLPPRSEMYRQFNDVYVVGNLRVNTLGRYCPWHFADRRVRPLVASFRAELEQLEFEIGERNASAPAPYEILLPSRVTASVHI